MATGDVYLLRDTIDALRLRYDPDGKDPDFDKAERLTHRGKYKPTRAKASRKSLTPALAAEIVAFAEANPHMSNRAIGYHFGVDGGRVSEAMGSKEVA